MPPAAGALWLHQTQRRAVWSTAQPQPARHRPATLVDTAARGHSSAWPPLARPHGQQQTQIATSRQKKHKWTRVLVGRRGGARTLGRLATAGTTHAQQKIRT